MISILKALSELISLFKLAIKGYQITKVRKGKEKRAKLLKVVSDEKETEENRLKALKSIRDTYNR